MKIEERCSCGAQIVVDCKVPVAAADAVVNWRREHRHVIQPETFPPPAALSRDERKDDA